MIDVDRLLSSLTTAELIRLDGLLSGGRYLGAVRRQLNMRLVQDYAVIKAGVHPFSWTSILGTR